MEYEWIVFIILLRCDFPFCVINFLRERLTGYIFFKLKLSLFLFSVFLNISKTYSVELIFR